MTPNNNRGRGSILYITDSAVADNDKLYVIPGTVAKKQDHGIISANGLRDSIQALKNRRTRISMVIVNATNADMTRLLAQLLNVYSLTSEIPVFFIAESFPPKLQDFLIKFGFTNLISISSSTSSELVAAINAMIQNLNDSQDKSADRQQRLILNEIGALKSLPPLPDVYFKVEALAHDENATSADFGRVLELDSAITARLLRMSNSAYFGFKRRIRSVKDAVTLMGTKEILSLVRIACITNNLKVSPEVEQKVKDVWIHCATCAITAQLIFQKKEIAESHDIVKEDLLICGILHDIGKIILWKYFPDLYLPVTMKSAYNQRPTEDEERRFLGCSHARVGETLAEHWRLPDHITSVIAYHHKPLVKPNSDLVYIIHIADLICKIIDRGYQLDGIAELDAPPNDLYTKDEIVSLARDLEAERGEQSEHVIEMIFG